MKNTPIKIKNRDEIKNDAVLDVLDPTIRQQRDDSSGGHIDGHYVHSYLFGHGHRHRRIVLL